MEVVISRDALVQALARAQGVLGRTDSNPALGCVKLLARGSELTVTATDTVNTLVAKYPATVTKEDDLLVDGKLLLNVAKNAPAGDLFLATVGASTRLRVSSKASVAHLNTLSADEFPPTPVEMGKTSLTLTGGDLDRMVSQIQYAICADENRYGLNGAFIHAVKTPEGKPKLRMAATDGSRLSYSDADYTGQCDLPRKNLLSRKAVFEVRKLIGKSDEVWTITFSDRSTSYSCGSTRLIARNVEGEFPEYWGVIPTDWKRRVKVGRADFETALRRVGLFATDKHHSAAVEFLPGLLVVTGENVAAGDVREEVTAEVEGEPMKTGFNIQYMQDVLGCCSGDLTIEIGDELDPCVIRASGSPDFFAIVMPMRIN